MSTTRPRPSAGQREVCDEVVDRHLEDPRQSRQVLERRLPEPLLPAEDQAVVAVEAIGQPAQREAARSTQTRKSFTQGLDAVSRE
jgi:hypothetical protein